MPLPEGCYPDQLRHSLRPGCLQRLRPGRHHLCCSEDLPGCWCSHQHPQPSRRCLLRCCCRQLCRCCSCQLCRCRCLFGRSSCLFSCCFRCLLRCWRRLLCCRCRLLGRRFCHQDQRCRQQRCCLCHPISVHRCRRPGYSGCWSPRCRRSRYACSVNNMPLLNGLHPAFSLGWTRQWLTLT